MCLPKWQGEGVALTGRGLFRVLVRSPCLRPADATRQSGSTDPGGEGIHSFGREAVAVSAAGTDHIDIGAGRHRRAFTAPVDEIPGDQHLPSRQVVRTVPGAGQRAPNPRRGVAPVSLEIQGFSHLHGVDSAPLVSPGLGARAQDPVADAGRAADHGLADSQGANTMERVGSQPQIINHHVGVEPGHGNLLARGGLACVTGRCTCTARPGHPVPVWPAE